MENIPNQPAPIAQPQKPTFPVGMILILVFLGLGFVSSLATLRVPITAVGPFFVEGIVAKLYVMAFAVVIGIAFFGTLKRKTWASPLLIIWQAYNMLLTTSMLLAFLADKERYLDFYQKIMPNSAAAISESFIMIIMLSSVAFSVIIGMTIIIYVYRRKKFFTN